MQIGISHTQQATQFILHLNSVGFLAARVPDHHTAAYCRCHVEGDSAGTKNGWYRLVQTPVGLRGYFGSYKQGEHFNIWRGDPLPALPPAKKTATAARVISIVDLEKIIEHAHHANPSHPYLLRKRVGVHGDMWQLNGALLLPMLNAASELVAIQRIYPNGSKPFVAGSKPSGAFFRLNACSNKVFIAEGYATSASILESLLAVGDKSSHVVMAGSATNLKATAISIKLTDFSASIFLVADDDEAGRRYAREAAESCEGAVIYIDELELSNE